MVLSFMIDNSAYHALFDPATRHIERSYICVGKGAESVGMRLFTILKQPVRHKFCMLIVSSGHTFLAFRYHAVAILKPAVLTSGTNEIDAEK